MKKDFTANAGPVYSMIETATQETLKTLEAQETEETRITLEAPDALTPIEEAKGEEIQKARKALKEKKKTRGSRINVCLDDESYEYIKIMAKVSGYSMPEFINVIIRKSMEKNNSMYKLAKDFRNSLE